MDEAFLTRDLRVRKHCAAQIFPNEHASLIDGEIQPQSEVGPLHALLSEPPRKQPRSRFEALKAPAKRVLIAARCRGLLSVKVTQKLVNKFGLWGA